MRIFSKIPLLILSAAIGFSSIGQIQNPSSEYILIHSDGHGTPAYIDTASRIIWGVINLDSSSSLVSVSFYLDSKEDKKNGSVTDLVQESSLEKFTSIYLWLARVVESSPTVGDLLYPFHFYF